MLRYNIKKSIKLLLLTLTAVFLTAAPTFAVTYYMCAQNLTMAMPDGTDVPMWGFALDDNDNLSDGCPAAATVPGPKLTVPSGESQLIINLRNDLTGSYIEPVSVVIPGQGMPTGFAPVFDSGRVRSFVQEAATGGGTQTYTWNAIQPGTYIYESGTHPQVQVQMGLYGALTKDSAAGTAYPGVTYDAERDLFYSEVDPALHAAVDDGTYGTAPGPTSTLEYKPRYFLLHTYDTVGSAWVDATIGLLPDGTIDPANTCIDTGLAIGDDILLRMYNAGLRELAPMMIGPHFDLVAEGGKPYPFARSQYQTLLMPGTTKDAIYTPAYGGNIKIIERRGSMTDAAQTGGGMETCISIPAPPVADPGGPYVVNEESAFGGEWTVIMNG